MASDASFKAPSAGGGRFGAEGGQRNRMSQMSASNISETLGHKGTLTVEEAEAVVRNLSKQESGKVLSDERTRTYKYTSAVIAVCSVVMVIVLLVVNLTANEVTKESHVSKATGEMLTLKKDVVVTESTVSFVPLMDLPKMPLSFLDQLTRLTLNIDGGIERVKVSGYRSSNSSVLVLWTKGGDERVVIKCGSARLYRADGTTVIDLKESHNAGATRALLAADNGRAKAYTLEELVAATAEHTDRALGASPLTTLYTFFGGVASSSMSATTANKASSTWGDAGDNSQCVPYPGFINAKKPTLPARSNWTLELPQKTNATGTTVWVPGTWYLAFDNHGAPMMRMESLQAPDVDNTVIHEIHGGKEYSYLLPDYWRRTASIANQPDGPCPAQILSAGTTCPAYNDVLRAHAQVYLDATRYNKQDCTVAREAVNEVEAENAAANAKLLNNPGDGSGLWLVGGFRVQTDTAGTPTHILDEDTGVVISKILSITEFHASELHTLFQGCIANETHTPVDQVTFTNAGLRRQLTEVTDAHLVADSVIHSAYAAMSNAELAEDHSRRLSSWTSFQAWVSNTNWCGAGTDIANTVCPSSAVSGDLTADKACRRHDHGAKSDGIIGGMAVRLGCDIDHDLARSTDNWCAQGIFGSWGLAQTWGCYDHGTYSCWNFVHKWWGGYWRYGGYCSGQHTHSGPWRYSHYSHRYGYRAKAKSCSGDIW